MAAYETGLKILKKQNDRVKNDKYLQINYKNVELLSHKIIDLLSKTERPEVLSLFDKFNDHDRVVQNFIESRFVVKKSFIQI